MLGGELVDVLDRGAASVAGLDLPEVDITVPESCREAVTRHDVVVNCAAYTGVDAAEDDEATAFAVNAVGPANLARACAESGAVLVHLSTDYVFAGQGQTPIPEDGVVAPRSAYGRTKASGVWAVEAHLPGRHYLVRTAWLYGRDGPSFVHTMRGLAVQDDSPVTVVDDQHGQPTWTRDVADKIVALLTVGAPTGTYHATSTGSPTWWDLAREVFVVCGADPDRVQPVPTSAYPRPAPRPAWSVLGHDAWARAGLDPIGDWRERLGAFMTDRFGGA
jgi:dTDP-4-dehydrorhamnose reductase